jgi:hypothetical protein
MRTFFEFEYDGWIDLYVRPQVPPEPIGITNQRRNDDCESSKWKVYRHDDRLRVYPPKIFQHTNSHTYEHLRRQDAIDALTIIGGIPVASALFQRFRSLHGKIVRHYARKKIENNSRSK